MESSNLSSTDAAQIVLAQKMLTAKNGINRGVDWFFWIAALSVLNSVIFLAGGSLTFVVGLGATQIVDGVISVLAPEFSPQVGAVIRLVAFGLNLCIAGVFAVFGVLGRKRFKWGVIAGMILYALDGLIFLVFAEWLGVVFHAVALFGLWRGLKAINELALLEKNQATMNVASLEKLLSAQAQAQLASRPTDRPRVILLLVVMIAAMLGLIVFVIPAIVR